jgi:hypothetical protein
MLFFWKGNRFKNKNIINFAFYTCFPTFVALWKSGYMTEERLLTFLRLSHGEQSFQSNKKNTGEMGEWLKPAVC